jgi:hypothetical protein
MQRAPWGTAPKGIQDLSQKKIQDLIVCPVLLLLLLFWSKPVTLDGPSNSQSYFVKNPRENGATCSHTHPTAPWFQERPSQGHADSSVKSSRERLTGPDPTKCPISATTTAIHGSTAVSREAVTRSCKKSKRDWGVFFLYEEEWGVCPVSTITTAVRGSTAVLYRLWVAIEGDAHTLIITSKKKCSHPGYA